MSIGTQLVGICFSRLQVVTVVPDTSNVTGLGASDPSSIPRCLRISLCELPCTQLPGYFLRRSGRLAHEVGGNVATLSYIGLGNMSKGTQLVGICFSRLQVFTVHQGHSAFFLVKRICVSTRVPGCQTSSTGYTVCLGMHQLRIELKRQTFLNTMMHQ